MEPLPRARRMPGLEVDVADLELDRLRRAQPAGVHRLEQRAVAQRGRLGAARLAQQLGDLVAAEDLRQLAALLRRAQVRGRVARRAAPCGAGGGRTSAGRRSCAAASRARRAACPRARRRARRRRRSARACPTASGSLPRAPEPLAELEQVGAVGLERVARQAALELEVGEEVEQQVLERLGRAEGASRWPRVPGDSPPRPPQPCPAQAAVQRPQAGRAAAAARSASSRRGTRRSSRRARRAGAARRRSARPRSPGRASSLQAGREEDVALLVGEAGRRVVAS